VEITDNTNLDGATINHVNGAYVNYLGQNVNSRYNPPAGLGLAFGNGSLYNLGPIPQLNVWQIRNGRTLAFSDALHNSANWTEVAEGVINLQAEYGKAIDANANGTCEPGESVNLQWNVTLPVNWSCVRAVRVALLARGQQFEKDAITTVAPPGPAGPSS